MDAKKRSMHIAMGPILFVLVSILLQGVLTLKGVMAIGTMVWMIYWWIARPYHIAVAGIVPVIVNAIFNIAPILI